MKFFCKNELEMETLALRLSALLVAPFVIYLYGNLGAGKTFLVRSILNGLGYKGVVKSPTYGLVEHYDWAHYSVYHLDLYRLDDAELLLYSGFDLSFEQPSITFVEWPEVALDVLPSADLIIKIDFTPVGRSLVFEAVHSSSLDLIAAL